MAMIQCEAGLHFYNNSTYSECPSCKAEGEPVALATDAEAIKRKTVPHQTVERKTKPVDRDGAGASSGRTPTTPVNKGNVKQRPKTKIVGAEEGAVEDDVLPVAGWLVIVDGPGKGRDFRLIQGENRIGRNADMEVCLSFGAHTDETVSGDSHAIVIYDNHSNVFFVERGASRNLPQVNGQTIRRDQDLVAEDIIQVGETQLMLVTLCSDRFQW